MCFKKNQKQICGRFCWLNDPIEFADWQAGEGRWFATGDLPRLSVRCCFCHWNGESWRILRQNFVHKSFVEYLWHWHAKMTSLMDCLYDQTFFFDTLILLHASMRLSKWAFPEVYLQISQYIWQSAALIILCAILEKGILLEKHPLVPGIVRSAWKIGI